MAEAGDVRNGAVEEDDRRRQRRKLVVPRPLPCVMCDGLVVGTVTRGNEDGQGGGRGRDPLQVLGLDLLTKIFDSLDARSVVHSILVSRDWQQIASCDSLWKPKCEELLKGKAHVSRSSMIRGASMLQSYSFSMLDSRRCRITKEDLCDHTWEFRFKKTAPLYWLNLDPSWQGTGPPMHRYFHPDGSQTADPSDKVWGGHECNYCIITSFLDGGIIRRHYVRINSGLPFSVVRKHDWSWEMDNELCCYSSIPDSEKKGGTGPEFPFW